VAEQKRAPFHRPSETFNPLSNFREAPREFSSWQEEQLSWKESCYLHAGLNPPPSFRISGPDAERMLTAICTNNVANVAVGASTHAVLVTSRGHVTASGMVFREAEDSFVAFIHKVLMDYHVASADWDVDVEDQLGKRFMFQVAGPRALEVLEAALGEDLHDIRFFRHRDAPIGSRTLRVTSDLRVMRMGMAGTLAYELHGDAEDALDVYNALLLAGEPFGIKQLGSLVYITSHHTENGFPNTYVHYPPAFAEDEAMVEHMRSTGALTDEYRPWPDLRGSMGPNLADRFVTPFDLGWFHAVKFDHDFIGRDALEPLADNPPRKLVTLHWNPDDVVDVYRSLFEPGAQHQVMTLPGDEILKGPMLTLFNDKVLKDGETVGMSMGRMYSLYYGAMISIAPVDVEHSALGTELTVLWGDPGTRQKEIRVTVDRFPYLDIERNEQVDVSAIPRAAATRSQVSATDEDVAVSSTSER
jgi:glycine cleavage system aminomethyltransferase T